MNKYTETSRNFLLKIAKNYYLLSKSKEETRRHMYLLRIEAFAEASAAIYGEFSNESTTALKIFLRADREIYRNFDEEL